MTDGNNVSWDSVPDQGWIEVRNLIESLTHFEFLWFQMSNVIKDRSSIL